MNSHEFRYYRTERELHPVNLIPEGPFSHIVVFAFPNDDFEGGPAHDFAQTAGINGIQSMGTPQSHAAQ